MPLASRSSLVLCSLLDQFVSCEDNVLLWLGLYCNILHIRNLRKLISCHHLVWTNTLTWINKYTSLLQRINNVFLSTGPLATKVWLDKKVYRNKTRQLSRKWYNCTLNLVIYGNAPIYIVIKDYYTICHGSNSQYFFSFITNKLECYNTQDLKGLPGTNTLFHLAYL